MSSLVIKTGMSVEAAIVKKYAAPNILQLTGEYDVDALDKAIPADCQAIISIGVCGGLSPQTQIGQAVIYDRIVCPDGTYACDPDWQKRLFAVTKYYERGCWSSGQFNTANDVQQRAQLFANSGCWVIDDESFAIAGFAHRRGISCIGMRTVSDGATKVTGGNLPPAIINALNPDGTDNLWEVVQSVAEDPAQIPALLETALNAKRSFDELETACIAVGPNFQWR